MSHKINWGVLKKKYLKYTAFTNADRNQTRMACVEMMQHAVFVCHNA